MISKHFFNQYEVGSIEECGAHCNLMMTPYKCDMFVYESGTQPFCNFGSEAYVTGSLPINVGDWPQVYTNSGQMNSKAMQKLGIYHVSHMLSMYLQMPLEKLMTSTMRQSI